MNLLDWQRDVTARLLADDPTPSASRAHTPAQRTGWAVTVALYRQWRQFRLRSVTPLTLAGLARRESPMLDVYFATNPGSTSYAAAEGRAFLDFVRANCEDPPIRAAVEVDAAILAARTPISPVDHDGGLVRSGGATLLALDFDLGDLVSWLVGTGDEPRPGPDERRVLVAPGVHGWVRPASAAECEVWALIDRPADVRDVPARLRPAMTSLCAAGAFA